MVLRDIVCVGKCAYTDVLEVHSVTAGLQAEFESIHRMCLVHTVRSFNEDVCNALKDQLSMRTPYDTWSYDELKYFISKYDQWVRRAEEITDHILGRLLIENSIIIQNI